MLFRSLDMARLKDSENFNGTLAQVEICSGYRLGDRNYAVVKKCGSAGNSDQESETGKNLGE